MSLYREQLNHYNQYAYRKEKRAAKKGHARYRRYYERLICRKIKLSEIDPDNVVFFDKAYRGWIV